MSKLYELCKLYEMCKLYEICRLYKLHEYFMNRLKSLELLYIYFCFLKF